ncbi:MAG TPA: hypothetical protein VKB41_08515 [Steroidobacteraceae bacterium]|nr:hypothetical protein [Steroidobacteraceae bacterium]
MTLNELFTKIQEHGFDAELMKGDKDDYISVMMPDASEPENPIEAYIHPHARGQEDFTIQYWQFGETIDVTAFHVPELVHLLTTPEVRDAEGRPAWCECRWHRS